MDRITGRAEKRRRTGRKRFLITMLSLSLAAGLSEVTALTAAAAAQNGPGDTDRQEEYLGQERNEKLKDDVLEYSELQDMIRTYNPTVLEVADSYNKTIMDYENAWAELKLYQGRADSDKDDAKDAGNAEQYTYYTAQEQTYKAAASSYYKMLDNMKKTASSTSPQRQTERQMTVAAQSLMVSYETLRQQKYTLEKMEELYKTQYELGTVKEQAGTAAAAEVLSFKNQVLAAQASLAEVEANMESIYNSLCLMVGREADGSLQVASIPAADPSRIGTMNLEEDTAKAIGNNYTLISDRHSLKVDSTSSSNYKLRTMEDGEQKLTSKMKRLYEDAAIKRDALEQARTGYEKARINKQQADTKYAIGMLSKDEYLMEELDYVQKEADYKAADLALQQAMDTYDWAVLGIADIE